MKIQVAWLDHFWTYIRIIDNTFIQNYIIYLI